MRDCLREMQDNRVSLYLYAYIWKNAGIWILNVVMNHLLIWYPMPNSLWVKWLRKFAQHRMRLYFYPRAQIHYRNQRCNVVNGTIRNKLRRNLNHSDVSFFQDIVYENVICKMMARPQCVKWAHPKVFNSRCHSLLLAKHSFLIISNWKL